MRPTEKPHLSSYLDKNGQTYWFVEGAQYKGDADIDFVHMGVAASWREAWYDYQRGLRIHEWARKPDPKIPWWRFW